MRKPYLFQPEESFSTCLKGNSKVITVTSPFHPFFSDFSNYHFSRHKRSPVFLFSHHLSVFTHVSTAIICTSEVSLDCLWSLFMTLSTDYALSLSKQNYIKTSSCLFFTHKLLKLIYLILVIILSTV